jgi:hypothetical protein
MHAHDRDVGILGNPLVAAGLDVAPVLSQDHVLFHRHLTLLPDSTVISEVDHSIMVNSPDWRYRGSDLETI